MGPRPSAAGGLFWAPSRVSSRNGQKGRPVMVKRDAGVMVKRDAGVMVKWDVGKAEGGWRPSRDDEKIRTREAIESLRLIFEDRGGLIPQWSKGTPG